GSMTQAAMRWTRLPYARKIWIKARSLGHSARQTSERRKPMTDSPVLWTLDARGVATVTLNRPEVNNAYDGALIAGVLAAMDDLGRKPHLRVGVLRGDRQHVPAA